MVLVKYSGFRSVAIVLSVLLINLLDVGPFTKRIVGLVSVLMRRKPPAPISVRLVVSNGDFPGDAADVIPSTRRRLGVFTHPFNCSCLSHRTSRCEQCQLPAGVILNRSAGMLDLSVLQIIECLLFQPFDVIILDDGIVSARIG